MKLWCFPRKHIKNCSDTEELTDAEKAYTEKMCGRSDPKTPLDETFFANMNHAQIKHMLSIVDMQDTMSSYTYAVYVKKLHTLATLHNIDRKYF